LLGGLLRMVSLRPVVITLALLLMAQSTAQAQSSALAGRWVPDNEYAALMTWDFNDRGSVTEILRALPGAYGTYRLDGHVLTMVFSDQSTTTNDVAFSSDTMT